MQACLDFLSKIRPLSWVALALDGKPVWLQGQICFCMIIISTEMTSCYIVEALNELKLCMGTSQIFFLPFQLKRLRNIGTESAGRHAPSSSRIRTSWDHCISVYGRLLHHMSLNSEVWVIKTSETLPLQNQQQCIFGVDSQIVFKAEKVNL